MNPDFEHTISIVFDSPFWIALFECVEKGQYSVAREVISTSEPTTPELLLFFEKLNYRNLHYTTPTDSEQMQKSKIGFKKMQKQVQRATEESSYKHTYSKAHEALKKQQEEKKIERKTISKRQKEDKEERKFEIRQQKKKQKMRGR